MSIPILFNAYPHTEPWEYYCVVATESWLDLSTKLPIGHDELHTVMRCPCEVPFERFTLWSCCSYHCLSPFEHKCSGCAPLSGGSTSRLAFYDCSQGRLLCLDCVVSVGVKLLAELPSGHFKDFLAVRGFFGGDRDHIFLVALGFG